MDGWRRKRLILDASSARAQRKTVGRKQRDMIVTARKFFIRSHAHAHVLEVGPPYIFIFYLDYIGMDVITCFKVLAMMYFIKVAMCLN